ncbi:MAG TPA: response regulator [Candidatus Eisenbacteria bacterium]|nr:response regulator [Candidatus Eisenbacteria bacterium]
MNESSTNAAALSLPTTARRPRILVAEDSTEMRRLIAGTLRAQGYDVTEARDGMELLDYIEEAAKYDASDRYAAVVSDVRMPWLSGMDVMAVLNAAAWRTPVVLITAFGDEETHAEGRALGAAVMIDKPFEMETLTSALSRLLSERTW